MIIPINYRFGNKRAMALLIALVLLMSLAAGRVLGVVVIEPDRLTPSLQPTAAQAAFLAIENKGQYPDDVRFILKHSHGITWITEDGIWISYLSEVANEGQLVIENINLTFAGKDPAVRLESFDLNETNFSYLLGNDPQNWHIGVPVWGGLRYRNLYPGIDLVLGGQGESSQSALPWRLEVQPGANPTDLRLQIDGASRISAEGNALVLETARGERSILLPVVEADPELVSAKWTRTPVSSVQAKEEGLFEVTFTPELLRDIRPTANQTGTADLQYSTYLGGNEWDRGYGVDVDEAGNIYVAGRTPSPDFPTSTGAYTTTLQVLDAFVVKINPAGSGAGDLVYGTFVGGSAFDSGYAMEVVSGEVYLTGDTKSSDFPTTSGAYATSCGSDGLCDDFSDAYMLKLSSDGSQVLYSTYFGGSNVETANGLAVSGGAVHIAGVTRSEDMPTSNGAYDRTCGTDGRCDRFQGAPVQDGFVAKFFPNGTGENDLVYGSFFGGSWQDEANAIAVSGGDMYITGETVSDDFPGTGYSGDSDAFVMRIDPAGSGAADLEYSVMLGGLARDVGNGIAAIGEIAYVTGETRSTDFPVTTGSYRGGLSDAFVAQLDGTGSSSHVIFLGGSDRDIGQAITLDESASMIVTGYAISTDFPVTADAYDTTHNNLRDIFISRINLNSSVSDFITYSTYLGGSGDDEAVAIVVNDLGNAFITGNTTSVDLPTTTGALDTVLDGSRDSFASQISIFLPPAIQIEKSTNTLDADEPPGYYFEVGTTIQWEYVISNNGDFSLFDIAVSDDQGVSVSCPTDTLLSGTSMTCSATGLAAAGQYANLGTVTANPPGDLDPISDNDASHYFGAIPGIALEKHTNGQDADDPPGVYVESGDPITWTYHLTNTGNVPLSSITVTDTVEGSANCPYTGLAANQTMTCVITGTAGVGQYANQAIVTATPRGGWPDVDDGDSSHYYGAVADIDVEKHVSIDGGTTWVDADSATGPNLDSGTDPQFRFVVKNTGNVALANVTLTDSDFPIGGAADFTIEIGNLAADDGAEGGADEYTFDYIGASWTAGQHTNTASVLGVFTDDAGNTDTPTDSDDANYYGTAPFVAGDVSCDKIRNVVDALFVMQYDVGLRLAAMTCPLAANTLNVSRCDTNSDSMCNVIDALFIMQCDVGITNQLCPTAP